MSVHSVKLREVADINPKGPAKGELSDGTLVDFVPMASVSEQGHMAPEGKRQYSEVAKGYTAFKNRDVLLAKITPCFENNKIALADVETDFAFGSTEFHVIRGHDDELEPRYLSHFLRQDIIRFEGERRMTGSGGQRRVPKTFLEELKIPLPPLEEQKRIAAILDQADALRRLRRRALDRLGVLGQAIFHEMFGDPAHGDDLGLGDVLLASGNGMNTPQDDTGIGVPITRIETIWNGTIDHSRIKWCSPDPQKAERHFLKPGDILFSHINSPDHIAKTAIYEGEPQKLLHGINLLRLQPDRDVVDPHWLLYLLKSDKIRSFFRARCKKAVNQASLNQGNLKELTFDLPVLATQQEFSKRTLIIEKEAYRYHVNSKLIEHLFLSLQHCAFRGEL